MISDWLFQKPRPLHTQTDSLFETLQCLLSSLQAAQLELKRDSTTHCDMLGILCTLITALAGISGVTVVTQSPPDLTKSKGQMVTMDCNLGTVIDRGAWWYKQVPGGIPQFVLFFYHTNSAPTYGSGFSSPKFTSKHTSKSDYSLIINDVEVGDSAVYYCKTWDDSAKEYVFGKGTKLFVTDSTLPAPAVTLFPPSSEDLQSRQVTLVCLVQDVSVGFADVRWTVGGSPVTSGVFTGPAEQQPNKKFRMSSYLTTQTSEWSSDKEFSCEVSAAGTSASKKMKKSDCSA
ncbi:immunoglobulin lambda-1 light chain-like isoform X1 [Denticeps clupeoides]|uniref:immunoglobulin lambda-1 light chain-like isoform X1 n=2 Tax=Denticeps clupeoides TaxID=299321 RepID=UPI0010A2EFC8|nr:immunoglobulin lambda-1 light chain-like isoform X1 [Denticeps clupeoides]